GGLHADNVLFLLSLPVFALAWTFLLLSLFTWGRATKAVLCAVLLVSAAIGYFANAYGVLVDHVMIANVVQTDKAEAFDLMSWRLAGWLLLFGVLPAVLLVRTPMAGRPWKKELASKAIAMLVAAACLGVVLLANYQHFASLLRNHRELRLMLVPYNAAAAV